MYQCIIKLLQKIKKFIIFHISIFAKHHRAGTKYWYTQGTKKSFIFQNVISVSNNNTSIYQYTSIISVIVYVMYKCTGVQ